MQSLSEEGVGVEGCLPTGHVTGRVRHWDSCTEPGDAVVFPAGQAPHWDALVAPSAELKVPSEQGVGEVARCPEKVPGGEGVQEEEPSSEEYVPALQGTHWRGDSAPEVEEEVPGGQGMQPVVEPTPSSSL